MTQPGGPAADRGTAMHRVFAAALLPVCALAGICAEQAASAQAAAAATSKPAITLVSPMRVTVGKTLTIRGKNFSARRTGNTVLFIAPNKQTAFAKPQRAGANKLVLRVPGSVERLLNNPDGVGVGDPTRLGIRVVVKRKYGVRSIRRNSPVVVSALRSGKPAACGQGSDFDNDLLTNSTEASIKTDPCQADTDGDGAEDGFEQESALDLNQRALPYPGKRPFPNALDPGDAGHDYDGDGISNIEEYRAWAHSSASPPSSTLQFYTGDLGAPAFGGPYGDRPRFGNHTLPLNYSDGDQNTADVVAGHEAYEAYLDHDGDGQLTDDERDADGDGLGNQAEIRGTMTVKHYPLGRECGYEYLPALPRPFLEPDYLDWDTDGDGVWDGNDDQDADDVANADEISPPYMVEGHPSYSTCQGDKYGPLPIDGARDGSARLRTPFNPCQPYRSRTCNRYIPQG